jgi:hypothetical protein
MLFFSFLIFLSSSCFASSLPLASCSDITSGVIQSLTYQGYFSPEFFKKSYNVDFDLHLLVTENGAQKEVIAPKAIHSVMKWNGFRISVFGAFQKLALQPQSKITAQNLNGLTTNKGYLMPISFYKKLMGALPAVLLMPNSFVNHGMLFFSLVEDLMENTGMISSSVGDFQLSAFGVSPVGMNVVTFPQMTFQLNPCDSEVDSDSLE